MTFDEFAKTQGITLSLGQKDFGDFLLQYILDEPEAVEYMTTKGAGVTTVLNLIEIYFKYNAFNGPENASPETPN